MLNHVLFYIGVAALVIVGLIVAGSAFVSIFASIRNSKAELAEQRAAEASAADITNDRPEVAVKETEEQ
ncbi:MAG: hypothetical protein IKS49_00675 [Actinomycetaceae bacterium]|nr:hypothetical protein [Actinomycetaceae bacterium]